jgi:hypothetical protein
VQFWPGASIGVIEGNSEGYSRIGLQIRGAKVIWTAGGPMKKITINAREIVNDIRGGKTDQCLIQKYDLSHKSLVRLKQELLARKFIKLRDLQNQAGDPPSGERGFATEQFVRDFRKNPDDVYLMQKYSLGPQQLKKVYSDLMSKGFLSEYEYHCREVKALEVETLFGSTSTTVVTIVDQIEELDANVKGGIGGQGLSSKLPKLYSGLKTGSSFSNRDPEPPLQHPQKNTGSRSGSFAISSTDGVLVPEEFCPNCGARKTLYSQECCHACGIVYSKFESYRVKWNAAIWKTDRPEP